MGMSQFIYIIKKYEDYSFEKLLTSHFIYEAWREAYDRGFEVHIEDELDAIIAMQDLIPVYEMDDMDTEERPTLHSMSYFGKNPTIFKLVKEKIELKGLELKEQKYVELTLTDVLGLAEKCRIYSENNPKDLSIKTVCSELNELIEYFQEEDPEDYFILYYFC